MPLHPRTAPNLEEVGGSVFSRLVRRLSSFQGEVYPLHIGDTWMEPAEGCRMEDFTVDDHPGMHRYAPPQGLPELREALAARVEARSGVPTAPANLIVTAGATGALGAAVGALVSPGEEVLILAPHWPLIAGIVRSFHGVPVPVPYLGRVSSVAEAVEAVETRRTDRTVALYLNTPNNPTGLVIPRSELEALAGWARDRDLWLLADEVYEDYVYDGEHAFLRSMAPERTFAAHSFSKAYGMAGNRCGYGVGPEPAVRQLLKVAVHTFYSTPTASQLAALEVLGPKGDAWIREARERYREMGRSAAERLGAPVPQGSTFLFLDVASHLDDRGLEGFLLDCADRGLFVAPGPSFGPYPTHLRICFTSAEPDRVRRGVEILASMLGR